MPTFCLNANKCVPYKVLSPSKPNTRHSTLLKTRIEKNSSTNLYANYEIQYPWLRRWTFSSNVHECKTTILCTPPSFMCSLHGQKTIRNVTINYIQLKSIFPIMFVECIIRWHLHAIQAIMDYHSYWTINNNHVIIYKYHQQH